MLFGFTDIIPPLGQAPFEVSAALNEGDVLVVRGPSGAGKTTLLRILARLTSAGSGEVFLQGKNWRDIPATGWRSAVHYMSQRPALFDGTAAANLSKPFELRALSSKKFDSDRAKALLEELLLGPNIWNNDARTLSGGEAARLAFVRALLLEPKVLLLDEPTAALDGKARDAFYRVLGRWLEAGGRTAVLVSHADDYTGIERVCYLDINPERVGNKDAAICNTNL